MVEVGGGEVLPLLRIGVVMLAVRQVALHHLPICRVGDVTASEAIKGGHEPGEAAGTDDAAGLQYAEGFSEGEVAFVSFLDVVERPEQNHGIDGASVLDEMAGVTDRAASDWVARPAGCL